ncbi:MAG: alpha/beta hydrolase [Candidatus Freyarchaeota archaeon]|nr:alpha/beta hydrolase [Candidatus Jordarchaeia archaeon]
MVPVKVEAFSIVSGGVALRGATYFPSGGGSAAVCFCHGLPREAKPVEEKGYSALAEKFAEEGFVSVIFNFQGTAGSGGFFSLFSWSRNLRDVLDHITSLRSVEPERVFVIAFSMGAIAATSIAATDDRVSGFVCCSCPYNAEQFSYMLREGF